MYALNGFDLDENTLDGHLGFASQPFAGLNRQTNSFARGQRDGRVSVRSRLEAPVVALVERIPTGSLQAFEALLNSPSLVLSKTDGSGVEAPVELTSASVENLATADPFVDVRFTLQFNDVFWRSSAEVTSTATAIGSNSVAVTAFPGISAPVRDAVIRVKGGVTGLTVADSRGTFFNYTAVLLSTEWLRFESATGRAYKTTTDTWTGGTEVTSLIDNGPGPYYLEVTPTFTDPSSRHAELTVTSSARTGSPTVQVRGKNAFLV